MKTIKILVLIFLCIFSLKGFAQKRNSPSLKKKHSKSRTLNSQSYNLEVGSQYKGGIVYELYNDGSGGKLFFLVSRGNYDEVSRAYSNYSENGIKFYMADDYDLQQLLDLGLIGPDKGDGTWNHLWFMGDRRMASYSYPYALTAKDLINLPKEYNERIAKLVTSCSKIDRYSGKCYFAMIGIFSLK